MTELATSFLDQNGMTYVPEGTIPVFKGTDNISKLKHLGGRASSVDMMRTMEKTLMGYHRIIIDSSQEISVNTSTQKPFFRYD